MRKGEKEKNREGEKERGREEGKAPSEAFPGKLPLSACLHEHMHDFENFLKHI